MSFHLTNIHCTIRPLVQKSHAAKFSVKDLNTPSTPMTRGTLTYNSLVELASFAGLRGSAQQQITAECSAGVKALTHR